MSKKCSAPWQELGDDAAADSVGRLQHAQKLFDGAAQR